MMDLNAGHRENQTIDEGKNTKNCMLYHQEIVAPQPCAFLGQLSSSIGVAGALDCPLQVTRVSGWYVYISELVT